MLTQDIVRELLDYDPATGAFTWKWRDIKWFKADGKNGAARSQSIWNAKWAGKPALTILRTLSPELQYLGGNILSVRYPAHRVAFLWMTGRMPDEIDHDDGDGTNNRWANLLEKTHAENQCNMRRHRRDGEPITVHVGVYPHHDGRYRAKIRRQWLGVFDTLDEAIAARQLAQRELGFTERHGS
jgi:HNH endonuclease